MNLSLAIVSLFSILFFGNYSEASRIKTEEVVNPKYVCTQDADCLNSCSQGAVNGDWYNKNADKIIECFDGCNNQTTDAPKCIDNKCVAFTDGKRNDFCTWRE